MVIPVVDPPPGLTSAELKTYWMSEARRVAQAAADLTRQTPRRPRSPIPPIPPIPTPGPVALENWEPDERQPPNSDSEPEPEDERPWFADDGQWITLDVDRETSDAA